MDAYQFLSGFGHIANAPGGIARLRELILELAIRGELLDSSDQANDASMLLAEIERHRVALIREGKLRRITPLPVIDNSELSFQLPAKWRFERLGNICEIVRGVTFSASKKQTSPSDTSVVCLRTTNVQSEVDWNDLIYIDEELVGREDQWVEKGDTLISMANSYELVGKVALVRNLNTRATFGGFLAAIRPHLLDPEYLYLVLRSPYMQTRMRSTASQTTNIANISLGGMRPIPTPIPPKEEQSRIVAKVDELMVLCDKLELQQQQRQSLQNNLRQATLQAVTAAFSSHELQATWTRLAENFGRLFQRAEDVAELRTLVKDFSIRGLLVEPDAQTVRQSIDERHLENRREELRKAKAIRASKPVSLPHDFEEPFPLPSGWKWFSLDQICYQITDGAHHTPRYVTSGVPFISVKDISGGVIDFSSTKFVSQETHAELVKRCNPEFGDVLLTKVGTTGIAKVVDTQRPFSLFVSVALLKFPQEIVDPHFLELLISSPFVKRQSDEGTRGIGNKNLVLNTIKGFLIPLPPISEQRLILTKAAELIKFCDLLESQLRSSTELVGCLAVAAVSSIAGISTEQEEDEPVKAPQTELIAPLRLGTSPDIKAQAPLASILARHKGEMSAKDLWQRFGGEIDAFYAQLKTEVAHGWILEPEVAVMREKEFA